MSAFVRVFVKGSRFGNAAKMELMTDRVPVQGDYIHIGGKNIAKVNFVILFGNNEEFAAYVYADHDPDDFPDGAQ
ncbi:hypothetical protein [Azospirillum tabaci]|uniref:hypothetical protein n=1 Tax=Azospirillum tabaci TaxID=2752310 RepID=UPI001660CADC|nr:hypothetical protein [Azospirillum tabaci]